MQIEVKPVTKSKFTNKRSTNYTLKRSTSYIFGGSVNWDTIDKLPLFMTHSTIEKYSIAVADMETNLREFLSIWNVRETAAIYIRK